jgi:hypothetical protein
MPAKNFLKIDQSLKIKVILLVQFRLRTAYQLPRSPVS